MKAFLFRSRITLPLCVILVLIPFFKLFASAQEDVARFPNRPITFISPLPPGAYPDLACRLIAKEAEKFLGQPVVVVNKTGGGQVVGAASIASAKPDGYTIGYPSATPLVITPLLEKVPYDPLKDFQEIMQCGEVNLGVVVKDDSPFKKFQDIIDYGRQNPKKVTVGTGGVISLTRLIMEQIAKKEGVQFTHIPFKGAPDMEAALLGGHLSVSASGFSNAQLEAGGTRLLLLFSEERRAAYPQVPILKDILGYYFPCPTFLNIAGPKGLPKEIVKKLEDAFTKAMKEPAFIKGMKDIQLPIVYRNSQELTDYVARSYEVFSKLLKDLSLTK